MTAPESTCIMAVEPVPEADWLAELRDKLARGGDECAIEGRSLAVDGLRAQQNGIVYSDGWRISKMWLGPDRHALAITARRFYYTGPRGPRDHRTESAIVAGRRPPSRNAAAEIEAQLRLCARIVDALGPKSHRLVAAPSVQCDALGARKIRIGTRSFDVPAGGLDGVYRRHGFDSVPANARLTICAIEGVDVVAATGFADMLRDVAHSRHAKVAVRIGHEERILERLGELEQSGDRPRTGSALLLLFPHRNGDPTASTSALLRRLDRLGVPYRRAYADDPHQFSIPNQFPAILLALGGRPHRIARMAEDRAIWMAGIDLSHPAGGSESTLALTLVDPVGRLRGAWVKRQKRDETAQTDTLRAVLEPCGEVLRREDPGARVLVLRDGRLFANEGPDVYRECLSVPLSVIEFRKRWNPLVLSASTCGAVALAPVAVVVQGSNTMFVATSPAARADVLPRVAKVCWKDSWNGLGLQPAEIAELLVAAATAPTLGARQSSLPAPIYWADGIAASSDRDLRFRGQGTIKL